MESLMEFRKRLADHLNQIDPEFLAHDEEEFWLIRQSYEYLEYFAEKKRYLNTAIALPLARGLHSGSHRKNPVIRGGIAHPQPYVIHCLTVCKMLADLWLPFTDEEKDILLASALCHDMIEDVDFENGGTELTEKFGLDPCVYETVKTVSKRYDFTPEQEKAFFQSINENKFAMLIKLSDRGHNVTDLYNMSEAKIREYIGETRTFFLPMCEYGREHYPELAPVIEIMQDQLICLTKAVEMLAAQHLERRRGLEEKLVVLHRENEALHAQLMKEREANA